jgi:hypothetical protein
VGIALGAELGIIVLGAELGVALFLKFLGFFLESLGFFLESLHLLESFRDTKCQYEKDDSFVGVDHFR